MILWFWFWFYTWMNLAVVWGSPVLNTPAELTVHENHTVTFTCTDTSDEAHFVMSWERNGDGLGGIVFTDSSCELVLLDDTIRIRSERYVITCERQGSTLTTTLVIPAENATEYEHNTTWYCIIITSNMKSIETRLFISVPVTKVHMLTPDNKSEVYISPSGSTTIQCITGKSRPQARVGWYMHGVNVTGSNDVSSNYSRDDVTGERMATYSSYQIRHTRTGNVTVICKATTPGQLNSIESNGVKAVFIALPNTSPLLTTSINVTSLYVGDKLSVTCSHRGGNPPPRLRWHGACAGTTATEQYLTDVVMSTISLTVTRGMNQQSCRCSSMHELYPVGSEKTVSAVFSVKYTPLEGQEVVIKGLDANTPVYEYDLISLSCQQKHGNPFPFLRWNFPGVINVPSMGIRGENNITINVTHNMDNMECTCIAHYEDERLPYSKQTSVKLDVYYTPKIRLNTAQLVVIEGEQVVVQCSAMGNPIPTLYWSRDNRNITDSFGGILSISKVNRTDDGQYICHASSHTPKKILRSEEMIEVEVHYTPLEGQEVVIKGLDANTPVYEYELIFLSCQQKHGNPFPFLRWNCPGVINNPSMGIRGENNVTINVTHTMDNMECSCIAHYEDERLPYSKQTSVKLDVYYTPIIRLNRTQLVVIEGEQFVIQCSATGNPTPTLYWSHDNRNITGSIGGILYISKVNRTDDGQYICHAISQTPKKIFKSEKMIEIEVHSALQNEKCQQSLTFSSGLGTGIGICLGVNVIVFITFLFFRRKKCVRKENLDGTAVAPEINLYQDLNLPDAAGHIYTQVSRRDQSEPISGKRKHVDTTFGGHMQTQDPVYHNTKI